MIVVIAPCDNRVGVDGHFRTVPLDMPHIKAVSFDGQRGHVEHQLHKGEWLEPRDLSSEEFTREFGSVLAAWDAAPDDTTPVPEQIRQIETVVYKTEHKETVVPQEVLDRMATLERDKLATEKAMQALLQVHDATLQRVSVLEGAMIALSNAAEAKLRERA